MNLPSNNSSSIAALLEARNSVGRYDSEQDISDQQIHELIRLATLAPSAYNAQNWRFIAVRSAAAKEKLRAAAYQQPQVMSAAVTFIVCGTLNMHQSLSAALQPTVDAHIMDQATADSWVAATKQSHENNPQLQRDEAIRSASLAAMTLMLAAQGMSLASGAMGGFDSEQVMSEFNLSTDEIPVMLVTVGHGLKKNWPQKPRKQVTEILEYA